MIISLNVQPVLRKKKYGLLITDTDVELLSWKKGSFEQIAIFSNDDKGVIRFADYLKRNSAALNNSSFRLLANVIGEDYRVEKVAHLIGKYKLDFHNRRMLQLFRGVSLCMSFVQGREERGRREDIVLFYGMLTEGKVLPWVTTITRQPSISLECLQPVSFVNIELVKRLNSEWSKKSVLLMTLHEKGLLRQTHHDRGHIQFSRVSKISDTSAAEVVAAIKKELERTIQYLHSLKISITKGIDIEFICPGNMVGQLRELIKSSEKIRFNFHDASAVAQNIGLETPITEFGRDSSLSMHLLFSRLWFRQLAAFNAIRYYWLQISSNAAVVAFLIYGVFGAANAALVGGDGLSLQGINSDLAERRDSIQRQYNEQFGQIEDPPSSPANITALAESFRVISQLDIVPGQLIYYFAQAYESNKRLQLDSMRWYVTGSPTETNGNGNVLTQSGEIYQILEVSGEFLPLPNETYIDVADRSDLLMQSFEERSDVEVVGVELPPRELERQNLGGVLDQDYNVDAVRDRNFLIRIIWKRYDDESIQELRSNQQI